MDVFDEAQRREEEQRAIALDDARRDIAAMRTGGTEFCADCEEKIPPARREAIPGATRCVGCQSRFERGVN